MARLWGKTFNYEDVREGDELPVLIKWLMFVDPKKEHSFYKADDLKSYVREAIIKTIPIQNPSENLDWITLELNQDVSLNTNLSLTGIITAKNFEQNKELIITFNIESDDGTVQQKAIATVFVI